MDEGTELAIARRGDDPIVMRLIHERDKLRAEVERLTHLHNLDHSLADQREAENERLLGMYGIGIPAEVQRLRDAQVEVERLKHLYDDVYAENQRLNQALDMLAEERAAWEADNERLRAIEQAARNLDARRDEGYATLVSYLIRLHETLERHKE